MLLLILVLPMSVVVLAHVVVVVVVALVVVELVVVVALVTAFGVWRFPKFSRCIRTVALIPSTRTNTRGLRSRYSSASPSPSTLPPLPPVLKKLPRKLLG